MNRPASRPSSTPPPAAAAGGNSAKPIREIRIGFLKACIWANATANGTMHNVTLSRSYKVGEEWRRSESFGRDDLLTVAKIADLAHSWICEQQSNRGDKERDSFDS